MTWRNHWQSPWLSALSTLPHLDFCPLLKLSKKPRLVNVGSTMPICLFYALQVAWQDFMTFTVIFHSIEIASLKVVSEYFFSPALLEWQTKTIGRFWIRSKRSSSHNLFDDELAAWSNALFRDKRHYSTGLHIRVYKDYTASSEAKFSAIEIVQMGICLLHPAKRWR